MQEQCEGAGVGPVPFPRPQEWAVRTYRKQRPAGDVTRLPDYERAQSELEQAIK